MNKLIVSHIWKRFSIGTVEKQSFIRKKIYQFSGTEPKKNFWALKDISFDAEGGDIIGIIGKNGSGKSTLLRTISGIYQKDRGRVKTIGGKIIAPANLNEGLKLRLTMKDNIFQCSSLLGLTKKEIKNKFWNIVKFAELEDYINTKLYQFSNGMIARLASAIVFYSFTERGDILLIDDETDIFDEQFKEKCELKLKEMTKKGAIILWATHDLKNVEKSCNKIMWIDSGKIIQFGGKEVIKEYSKGVAIN
ncbi:Trehalose/maltose import ATP-binding protein MalK [uncultured archaeon]|nr:Trehalose/maltose import ATP-binding protein MalK [uncultured archaeon]